MILGVGDCKFSGFCSGDTAGLVGLLWQGMSMRLKVGSTSFLTKNDLTQFINFLIKLIMAHYLSVEFIVLTR